MKIAANRVCRGFAFWQENKWNSENIIVKWVAEVWRKSIFQLKMKTLLVLDNAITHKIL